MQDSGSLAVFKVTARDQGHYKAPSGAFVTYCNISCFVVFGGGSVVKKGAIKLNYIFQGVGVVLKPKQYDKLSNEVKYKKATIHTM